MAAGRRGMDALVHNNRRKRIPCSKNQEPQSLRVELRLYASLRKYLPGEAPDGTCQIELDEGATIKSLFAAIHLPADAPKIIFLNGIHARGDEVLKEGDRVGAFPPVAGG